MPAKTFLGPSQLSIQVSWLTGVERTVSRRYKIKSDPLNAQSNIQYVAHPAICILEPMTLRENHRVSLQKFVCSLLQKLLAYLN